MLRTCTAFILLFLCLQYKITACGYNFIGDCSTNISLKINGTQDNFAVASCPDVLKFDGFMLGSLQSLAIARVNATTWESCLNNVTSVALYYRVYEQGLPGGAWQNIDLQEDYNTLVGPYTTRYRSANTNTSLTDNLTAGNTYVLEIYFLAEVDTLGDDFIPETTLLQNNNGQNYHFTFQYGGPAAPPFLAVPTKIVPVKCYGDSTGVAGVSVYGNQANLFYEWSTGGNNSPVLNLIPAGIYSVTVTGAGGYTAYDTIEIGQPMPLSVQVDITPPGCGGIPAGATASPSGGVLPYYYDWSDGEQTKTATFVESGDYSLTVLDTFGCSVSYPVSIPPPPVVEENLTREICAGESYAVGNTSFSETGNYTVQVAGSPNCDTIIYLDLSVLDPAAALQNLPDTSQTVCLGTAVDLCAEPVANTTFNWLDNGVPLPASPCIHVTPVVTSMYAVTATTTGASKTCLADKSISVYVLPLPYATVVVQSVAASGCLASDSVYYVLKANTNAQVPVFQWTWKGQVISSGDTCILTIPANNFPTDLPDLTVTDNHGCSAYLEDLNGVISPPPPLQIATDATNPSPFQTNGSISLIVTGGFSPYAVIWSNNQTDFVISDLSEGTYCATVTDAIGCTTTVCESLTSTGVTTLSVENSLRIAPNPASPGQQIKINLPKKLSGQEVRIEILDLYGRTLLRQTVSFYQETLYVSLPENLPAGTLIIRSWDNGGKRTIGRVTVH